MSSSRDKRNGGGGERLTRDAVRAVGLCPLCQAPPGEVCRGARGPRLRNHEARWQLVRRLVDGGAHV
jgi:hypothetical protein